MIHTPIQLVLGSGGGAGGAPVPPTGLTFEFTAAGWAAAVLAAGGGTPSYVIEKLVYNGNPFPIFFTAMHGGRNYNVYPGNLGNRSGIYWNHWSSSMHTSGVPSYTRTTESDPAHPAYPWLSNSAVPFNNTSSTGASVRTAFLWDDTGDGYGSGGIIGSAQCAPMVVIPPFGTVSLALKLKRWTADGPQSELLRDSLALYWGPTTAWSIGYLYNSWESAGANIGDLIGTESSEPFGEYFLNQRPSAMNTLTWYAATDELEAKFAWNHPTLTSSPFHNPAMDSFENDFVPILYAPVKFSGSGVIPSPLVKGTIYYCKPTTGNKFNLTALPIAGDPVINIGAETPSVYIAMEARLPGGAAKLADGAPYCYSGRVNASKEAFSWV